MLTRDDLIDIFTAALPEGKPVGKFSASARARLAAPPQGKLFLSEYDVKKRLTPGGTRLTIPGNAILSPLVADWLTLRGIEVVRE